MVLITFYISYFYTYVYREMYIKKCVGHINKNYISTSKKFWNFWTLYISMYRVVDAG